jgi:hypothetical protein
MLAKPLGVLLPHRLPSQVRVLRTNPADAYVLVMMDLLRLIGMGYINARAPGRQELKLAETLPREEPISLDIQLP